MVGKYSIHSVGAHPLGYREGLVPWHFNTETSPIIWLSRWRAIVLSNKNHNSFLAYSLLLLLELSLLGATHFSLQFLQQGVTSEVYRQRPFTLTIGHMVQFVLTHRRPQSVFMRRREKTFYSKVQTNGTCKTISV